MLAAATAGEVTEELLAQRLREHVERIDIDMALEYQARCRCPTVSVGYMQGAGTTLKHRCVLNASMHHVRSPCLCATQRFDLYTPLIICMPHLTPCPPGVQMQQGMAAGIRADAYLTPAAPRHAHGPDLHTCCAVLRLLAEV